MKRSSSSQMHNLSKHSSKSSNESFYANSSVENAVSFTDVKMSYGQGKSKVQVLRGVDMKVPEGAIYALLGPSGCGKTTLCNCITGRNKPTSGAVRVFNKIPGTPHSNIPGPIIGYMPQEISLFPDFTIEETLLFFSNLYRLDKRRAKDRMEFLVDFLELPDKKRMVANLSGGQQRRVSLAAALIHSPPLLILDEPTVGVDPVLRQVIWDYLVLLSTKEQLSIIITTHYIEEARAANVCGLMRQGKLLVEESPDFLMEKFKCPSLEAVFLQLSRASDNSKSSQNPSEIVIQAINDSDEKLKKKPSFKSVRATNLAPVKETSAENSSDQLGINKVPNGDQHRAPTMKQIAQDKQDKQEKIARLPNGDSIQGIVNGRLVPKFEKFEVEETPPGKFAAFKQESVQSCNRVKSLTKKNFARLLRNLPMLLFQFLLPSIEVILFCICIGQEPFNLPVSVFNEEGLNNLQNPELYGNQFLSHINNKSVIQVPHTSQDDAMESVRLGRSWAAMIIHDNFTEQLKLRQLTIGDIDAAALETSSVHLHLDMSNYLIGLQLQRIVLQAFQKFAHDILVANNMSAALAEIPVKLEEPIYGDREPTFTEFMAPGVLLSIAFLAAVALTAIALVQEKKEGSLERCLVAGCSSTEFIMSHVFTQSLVLNVQVALLLVFTFLVFEIPSRGPFFWVAAISLLQSSCGMAFGLMISAMTKEETSATMLALGSFYPNLLLSGTVWPTQAMPDAMRYFSYCLPQTLPIESLRYILSRGWDVTYPEVATGFAVTIGWTVFFLIAAVVIFKAKV